MKNARFVKSWMFDGETVIDHFVRPDGSDWFHVRYQGEQVGEVHTGGDGRFYATAGSSVELLSRAGYPDIGTAIADVVAKREVT